LSIFRPFRDNGCVNQFDAMLTKIEGFAKAGTVKNFQLASSLHNVHRHSGATEDHKKKALAVAKTLVENKSNEGFPRARALAFIGEVDPGAKAYAQRFKNDDDFSVKRQAEDIIAGKGFKATPEETRVSTKPVPGKVEPAKTEPTSQPTSQPTAQPTAKPTSAPSGVRIPIFKPKQ
ncbi:MAG TPA: PT domain-containing protein, partial [Polyangiaceae bacterium]|nr:PT domain-containing protein [Polyangiaceae bacterium]